VLLPDEDVCVERVGSRTGHGFTDLDATRHMYREFAESALEERHVMRTVAAPEDLASSIVERVLDGSLRR